MEALDRVLVDKPATRPPLLVDTLGGGVQGGNESACEEEENDRLSRQCADRWVFGRIRLFLLVQTSLPQAEAALMDMCPQSRK